MPFVSQYIINNHTYNIIKSITVGNHIYNLGSVFENNNNDSIYGLITKNDLNGNLIWEKKLKLKSTYVEVIDFVKTPLNDIIVLYKSIDYSLQSVNFALTRINSNGNEVWTKTNHNQYSNLENYNIKNIFLTANGLNRYTLIFTHEYYNNNVLIEESFISIFNSEGNKIISKSIDTNNGYTHTLSGLKSFNNQIYVFGNYINQDDINVGFLIKYNYLLEIVEQLAIRSNLIDYKFQLNDININLNKIIFNGVDSINNFVIGVKNNLLFDNNLLNAITIDNSLNLFSNLNVFSNNYNLYIELLSDNNLSISKLSNNFNLIWTKSLISQSISNFITNVYSNRILGINYKIVDSFCANLDLDLNACIFSRSNELFFSQSAIVTSIIDEFDSKFSDINFFNNSTRADLLQIELNKNFTCILPNEVSCETDLEICNFIQDINERLISEEILHPDSLNDNDDFSEYSISLNQIVNDFSQFIFLNNLSYLNNSLSPLLNSINAFSNDPNYLDYTNVWFGIFNFINKLSNIGNCDCSNSENEDTNLILSEKSNLQSSHLYLQATGSSGSDSTRGFHLRWQLKNALENHLPKGNYANTFANFNKKNDFVKIYRAKYEKIVKTLDFNLTPNFVFNNSRKWVYKIENNIINIYFKNAIKYNTVKNAIDPTTFPLEFIQNYGNELIEIEFKNNLIFSFALFYSNINPSSITQIETCSVEGNNNLSDLFVSYRTSKVTNLINQNSIIQENIKRIKLKTTAANLNKIEFESYSNFLNSAINIGNIQFLGKYSLSLNDDIAFNRLEPQIDSVNNNWLRYNDNAKVKVQNYKDKWNNEQNIQNQIKFVVDKYIHLSDEQNNPKAVEIYSFTDLQNEPIEGFIPDPSEYNPNELQNFEISNLQLLQVAALDYHVSRMLGLGVLDINENIVNDKYIYIAEYITYKDLNDSFGVREVQHLYCSLPTTINDERLPLPINLKYPTFGIYQGNNTEVPNNLTDQFGYTPDGGTRFVSLFHEPILDEEPNSSFFHYTNELDAASFTNPVYAGIEYKFNNDENWVKPELVHDKNYYNLDNTIETEFANETLPILIPETNYPLFIHREKISGIHKYSSYGINWFSRSKRSEIIREVETIITRVPNLLPPFNINSYLIKEEVPLLLTSQLEQLRYENIIQDDKTLVRVLFEYNHSHELKDYHKLINGELVNGYIEIDNNEEYFVNKAQILFKPNTPNLVSGKIISVIEDNANPLLAIVDTGVFDIISSGLNTDTVPYQYNQQLIPNIQNGTENNFIGSFLVVNEKEFLIQNVFFNSTGYPIFKVLKRGVNGPLLDISSTEPMSELSMPDSNELFTVIENLQNTSSWLNNSPLNYEINIADGLNQIFTEEINIISTDGTTVETHVQKFRGKFENATITKVLEDVTYRDENNEEITLIDQHLGVYKIEFENSLLQHSQFQSNQNSIEWFNGIVRLHTYNNPNGKRKEFKVIKTQNIGIEDEPLILFVEDDTYNYQEPNYNLEGAIVEGIQLVNYYPGYKMYLYADSTFGFNESNIMPQGTSFEKLSVLGLRSKIENSNYISKISIPSLLHSSKTIKPLKPELPIGGKYATRPDFFNKATYSFSVAFNQVPYAVQFNRTSDIQILTALYDEITRDIIINELFKNGTDEFYVNRWENLLSFNYVYADEYNQNHTFKKYPDNENGISLPLPNSIKFIESINNFITEHNNYYNNQPFEVPNLIEITSLDQIVIPEVQGRNLELKVVDFFKSVIHNCFVPLTEIPIIYNYIKSELSGYRPKNKKQIIRDRNGYLLKQEDPSFDMAPMAMIKIPNQNSNPIVKQNEVLFTDFNIDGASNAKYFYCTREFGSTMQAGEYSDIIGPISLINSAPPATPEIVKVLPVLENKILNIKPSIKLEINKYQKEQNIKIIQLYRTFDKVNALSVRNMELIKDVILEDDNLDLTWIIEDDFNDLQDIPYSEMVYYRIVVLRQIKYNDLNNIEIIDYAPSEPSKLIMTNIVENYSPESPYLKYYSEPMNNTGVLNNVILCWEKTVHNGKYYIYKMSNSGNWEQIAIINSNNSIIYIELKETNWNSNDLTIIQDETNIYHHFKIIAENSIGMKSNQENILTIYNPQTWQDIGGIDNMIIEGTFIIRP